MQQPDFTEMPPPLRTLDAVRWRAGSAEPSREIVAEEVPVALVYNGISHAVMMATPQDLADFALGFSLTEGILAEPSELYATVEVPAGDGIELRLTVAAERFVALKARRRNLTGRTGCGICGVDSLADAIRPARDVGAGIAALPAASIVRAMAALPGLQVLNHEARAVHAAAWALADGSIAAIREDVGRHNALDKLAGHLAASGTDLSAGFLVMTSRCSYEIVQKAVAMKIGTVVSVSAPTALAVRLAESSNVTLLASVRDDRWVVYAHGERITG